MNASLSLRGMYLPWHLHLQNTEDLQKVLKHYDLYSGVTTLKVLFMCFTHDPEYEDVHLPNHMAWTPYIATFITRYDN